jgi:hypothetical protein
LLAPQAASAIDFAFSFAGVTGLIENLVDGYNTCKYVSACVVTVTNTGAADAQTGIYRGDDYGSGFTVITFNTGPRITAANWSSGAAPGPYDAQLCFGQTSLYEECRLDHLQASLSSEYAGSVGVIGPVTFAAVQPLTPSSPSVPGPLPLFGAAAAFGFSRKLRNRIKVIRTTAPTRQAG